MDRFLLTGLLARIAVRLVKPFAFEILDADRSIFFVEKHLGRERVELDGQIAGIFLLDLQQKFARAVPSALGCGQRRQAKSDRVILYQAPVVRIEPAEQGPPDALERHLYALSCSSGRVDNDLDQPFIFLQSLHWNRDFCREPALVTMTRGVPAKEFIDPPPRKPSVGAVLHALVVLAHVLRLPRGIARQIRKIVPVLVVRIDHDHGVVRRAAAQCPCPRIEYSRFPVDVAVLGVFLLLLIVAVMADPKIPSQRVAFGGDAVKNRDVVVVRQTDSLWVPADATHQFFRIAARFQNKHLVPGLRQSRRDGPASGARAHYDVFEFCVRFAHAKSPFLASVACRAISAPCARLRARPSTNRCDRCARSDG